ncbi:hypothetical protein I79_011251 [Cricetulus griseus]|uniref:Uncharacterized protein n=1 Tax=Cricetulus griseus TaxID=10029 RepID=G3HKM2_CRIGR|nr:hypothetical protein I79_011251 [Cricetulus griseus]
MSLGEAFGSLSPSYFQLSLCFVPAVEKRAFIPLPLVPCLLLAATPSTMMDSLPLWKRKPR